MDPHTVTVRAFDCDGNPGPMSDESDVLQMVIAPPLYADGIPASVRSDLDGNGTVGYSDFGLFSAAFGTCNDGIGHEVAC